MTTRAHGAARRLVTVVVPSVSLCFLAISEALAQTPDSAAAPQAADSPVVELAEVRVAVSRLFVGGVDAARVPFFFSLQRYGAIQAASVITAADALARLPGVHLNNELGAPAQPDVTLRGFTISPVVGLPQGISVFVDGVRVNEPDAAQVNFDLIPLRDVERIEVIRGPIGPYGRNTLSGALNIVTRRGGQRGEAEIEVVGGSFTTVEGRAQVGGTVGGFDYYGSGRYLYSDGWRAVTATSLAKFFAKVGHRGVKSDFWVSYHFARDSIEQAGSLPSSWLEGDLPPEFESVEDPREINFTGGDFFRPRLHFVTANYALQMTPKLSVQTTGYYRSNDVEQFNANITEADVRGLSDLWSAGLIGQLSYEVQPGLVLLGGAEYVRDDVDAKIFAEPNEASSESGLTTHVATDQTAFGTFGQVWWLPHPRLSLLGSLRYDYLRIPFRDLLDPSNDGTNTYNEITASVGADYLISKGSSVYASYGRGFRAPVILELACSDPEDPCPLPFELGADPPLDPVATDTWQAGVRFTSEAGSQLELTGYWSEVHDEIFNVTVPPTTRGFFTNIERTRRQGVDVLGAVRPHDRIALVGELSYTRATFQSSATLAPPFLDDDEGAAVDGGDADVEPQVTRVEPGDQFPLIPGWRASLGATYGDGRWRLGVESTYIGSQWLRGDESNTFPEDKLDPYILVDAYAERSIGPAVLYLRLQNVLDVEYESFGVIASNPKGPGEPRIEPFLTPGYPFGIYVGARWRF